MPNSFNPEVSVSLRSKQPGFEQMTTSYANTIDKRPKTWQIMTHDKQRPDLWHLFIVNNPPICTVPFVKQPSFALLDTCEDDNGLTN